VAVLVVPCHGRPMAVTLLPGRVSGDAGVWMAMTRWMDIIRGLGIRCRKRLRGQLLIVYPEEDPAGYWFVVYWWHRRYWRYWRALPVRGYAGGWRCTRKPATGQVGVG
jgi:hypothetical protein